MESTDTVYCTKEIGPYKCINFKRGDDEHVAVYENDVLVKDYIQNFTTTVLQHRCNFTMFSDTYWFFLNPFHTMVECYKPKEGRIYLSLAQGQVTEVRGSWYKDGMGWYNGAASTMAARMGGGYKGEPWPGGDQN